MRFVLKMMALVVAASPSFAQSGDCDSAQTQMELTACAKADWAAADEELNGAYKDAIRAMKDLDANLTKADRGAEESLRAAQRAWVAFRDTACEAEAYPYIGGSIQPMIQMGCLARLTWSRVGDLYILTEQGQY